MADQTAKDEEKRQGRQGNAEEYPVFNMASITIRTENGNLGKLRQSILAQMFHFWKVLIETFQSTKFMIPVRMLGGFQLDYGKLGTGNQPN